MEKSFVRYVPGLLSGMGSVVTVPVHLRIDGRTNPGEKWVHFGITSPEGAKTFSLTTFRIMTLSIMGLFVTLSIDDSQHKDTQDFSVECCYAEFSDYLNVMLSVIMLNAGILSVAMISVLMLNVLMLSVVAPSEHVFKYFIFFATHDWAQ
jgi:hypothetical protein